MSDRTRELRVNRPAPQRTTAQDIIDSLERKKIAMALAQEAARARRERLVTLAIVFTIVAGLALWTWTENAGGGLDPCTEKSREYLIRKHPPLRAMQARHDEILDRVELEHRIRDLRVDHAIKHGRIAPDEAFVAQERQLAAWGRKVEELDTEFLAECHRLTDPIGLYR